MSGQISADRQDAIELARHHGWAVTRDGNRWKFTRPDTGGLWDAFYIAHKSLGLFTVIRKLEAYDVDLSHRVLSAAHEARCQWLREAHPKLFKKYGMRTPQ